MLGCSVGELLGFPVSKMLGRGFGELLGRGVDEEVLVRGVGTAVGISVAGDDL